VSDQTPAKTAMFSIFDFEKSGKTGDVVMSNWDTRSGEGRGRKTAFLDWFSGLDCTV
jgi:hypothetical protein